MIDKIFSSIDFVFMQLKETKGEHAKIYSQVNLNNLTGVLKSIYWLIRLTAKPLKSE